MKTFLSNVILALIWGALSGEITGINLLFGFIMGYIILYLAQRVTGNSRYFGRVWSIIVFMLYFLYELVVASLRVAYDVMTPTHYNKPGIIAYALDQLTDIEITLLANVISLTPGTLSLDVSEDRKTLYIHAMFIDDADELRREIKNGLERRLLEVLR